MTKHTLADGDVLEVLAPVQVTISSPGEMTVPFASESVVLPILNTDAAWYEATRRYGPYNHHPYRCEDLNLESGGNTDLGEPLVAPFNGLVLAAGQFYGAVGRVVQILGIVRGRVAVWCGWHLKEVTARVGNLVRMGEAIGSIGNADGKYAGAHLHHQVCYLKSASVPHPTTFPTDDRYGWVQPSHFFQTNGVDPELVERVHAWDGR
jgi:hypothetical protein